MMKLLSVNVSLPKEVPYKDKTITTSPTGDMCWSSERIATPIRAKACWPTMRSSASTSAADEAPSLVMQV